MDRRPLVSVVIPNYNYGRFLPATVGSVTAQQGVDLEVIIVDDKSTDGSADIARALAEADPRIRLIEHAVNLRHIRTFNDGLLEATGDYVVLLSADDALTPNSLVRGASLLEAHPSVGLAYGRVAWFDGELPPVSGTALWWQVWSGTRWIRKLARRGRNAIVSPEAMMRRSILEDIGGYSPEFSHTSDLFMWLQAAARSDVGFIGGACQAYYRNHGENMHSIEFGGATDDAREVMSTFDRFFEREGGSLTDPAHLRRLARRGVAREAMLRAAMLQAEGAHLEDAAALRGFARDLSPQGSRSAAWAWSEVARRAPRLRPMVALTERQRWRVRSRRDDLVGL
jgi:glycosyltransferase involved in cell wall biosynthesis